jgi:hypothetical protein
MLWQNLIQLLVFVCIQPHILIRVEPCMASHASILVTPCLHLYDMRLMREKGDYHKKCRLQTMTVAQVKQFLLKGPKHDQVGYDFFYIKQTPMVR